MSYSPTPGDTLFYYTATDHTNPFGFAVSKVESDGSVSGMQLRYYGTPTSTAWQQIHNLPLVQFGDTPPTGEQFVTPRTA